MCGLVSALACGEFVEKRLEKVRQESMIFLMTELLQLTQPRGKDATGIATLFGDCDYMGLKMGISAQEFIARFGDTEEDYEGYLKIWRKKVRPAKISIGHCRKPSTGGMAGAENNKNNHPIKIGDIVGAHNGTLTNHEKIFTNLGCKRDGVVDSEAIFRLLHHYTNNGTEPFTVQAIQETCKRISGSYAVLAFSGNNPFQMAAFRDGRPLEIAIIRPIKLALISSEKDYLKTVIFRYNKMANLYQTGPLKFAPLKKGDVDIETLADDSLYLFDVRKDITEDTKIKDLYVTEKIPRAGKIWVKADTVTKTTVTTNTNPNWNANHQTWNAANGKKTEVTASFPATSNATKMVGQQPMTNMEHSSPGIPTTISPESINRNSCMAWNKKSHQYESIAGVEASKKHGNMEINCDNGEIVDVGTKIVVVAAKEDNEIDKKSSTIIKGKPKFDLTESDKPVDDLISDPARISEIKTMEHYSKGRDVEDPVIAIYKRDKTADTREVSNEAIDIDLGIYPDVVENAVRITRAQSNFSNDMELANALEITNVDAMKNMEMYSLANRIKAFFYKLGWASGYITRLKEEKGGVDENKVARSLLIRTQAKQHSAQDTVRVMKSITRVFARILKRYPEDALHEQMIEKAVNEVIKNGDDLNPITVGKAFRPGDFQEMPILNKIVACVNKE